jgi:hypothetical protein
MKTLLLQISAAVLATAAFSQFANASTINFGGSVSGPASGGPPPSIDETFSGSGVDSTFGAFNVNESAHVDISGSTVSVSNGVLTFVFPPTSGGFTADFTGSGSTSGTTATVTLDLAIVSGLLAGETGTMTGTGSFDTDTQILTVNYSGSLSGEGPSLGFANGPTIDVSATPIPATLPLFASGLGAMGLLGWRRKKKAVPPVA